MFRRGLIVDAQIMHGALYGGLNMDISCDCTRHWSNTNSLPIGSGLVMPLYPQKGFKLRPSDAGLTSTLHQTTRMAIGICGE